MDIKNKKAMRQAYGFSIKKIAKRTNDVKRIQFYLQNYIKLLDQYSEWAWRRRFDHVQKGDWKTADEIDELYLKPIERKLNILARAALEELNE